MTLRYIDLGVAYNEERDPMKTDQDFNMDVKEGSDLGGEYHSRANEHVYTMACPNRFKDSHDNVMDEVFSVEDDSIDEQAFRCGCGVTGTYDDFELVLYSTSDDYW